MPEEVTISKALAEELIGGIAWADSYFRPKTIGIAVLNECAVDLRNAIAEGDRLWVEEKKHGTK